MQQQQKENIPHRNSKYDILIIALSSTTHVTARPARTPRTARTTPTARTTHTQTSNRCHTCGAHAGVPQPKEDSRNQKADEKKYSKHANGRRADWI